ncbi:transcription antitermination protein NusB [Ureaplasma urealyticum]|uniref:Transcription antitermination protein NusB n=3 Tax=Ureaplasma urealyticum TaxID=2130 RepID=A0AAP9ACH2_UREUR|nr:transcription antitermination protein NusB [Ureaplasma urealyticum]EDX53966.1 transcription antitermination factor NusB [Ureaplasma urealyticum serovar 9 str. ATCC 33175]ACI60241.1 transcription antitermination factor NusB [Ureaplasma urealyticum serovar 10 str. ATCC 33699]EDT49570.1 transcription antitermination factor NusB [Ureaplasma urealyticum serovar 13 str. ATCC 33698]EDU06061.1 transcription antitermination factor NusB [Ureaplasma urealyticum serovar 5 str. ATCC 27817]EDU56872.1 tra
MKTQWAKRVKLFQFVYHWLITKKNKTIALKSALVDFELDVSWLSVSEYILDNCEQLIKMIKPFINKDWTFERLSYVEQALLLSAYGEYLVLKTPKKIIIDQTLITTHNYSNDESYKFINAILDQLLN